jgi:hypothetical protein
VGGSHFVNISKVKSFEWEPIKCFTGCASKGRQEPRFGMQARTGRLCWIWHNGYTYRHVDIWWLRGLWLRRPRSRCAIHGFFVGSELLNETSSRIDSEGNSEVRVGEIERDERNNSNL